MKLMIAMVAVFAAIGCTKNETGATPVDNNPADAPHIAADNTAKNERDRHEPALTPGDQAENAADRTITQQVRQGVIKGDDISVAGKNVKIITIDGVVTLRGPVESAKEKSDIATVAKQVDGVKRVDNQLEIATK
jgi:osmotically-inducible protein OsmY